MKKKRKRNFCFVVAHDDLKPKAFVGWGTLSAGVRKKRRRDKVSKWKEHIIPKRKEKSH